MSHDIDIIKAFRKSFQGSVKRRPSYRRKTIQPFYIIIDGKDLTPRALNPEVYTAGKEWQLNAFDINSERSDQKRASTSTVTVFRAHSIVRFKDGGPKFPAVTETGLHRGSLTEELEKTISETFESQKSEEGASESEYEMSSPGDDTEKKKDVVVMGKPPSHIELVLNETSTYFLLDIPSATVEKDTEEGNLVEQENEHYAYLTQGKGRNRKVQDAETQTVEVIMKSRSTVCQKPATVSKSTFASSWDMYDSYQRKKEVLADDDDDDGDDDANLRPLEDVSSVDAYKVSNEERQLIKLAKNTKFLEALGVVERILANNCYGEEQKVFRGLSTQDDFRENIEYKYKLRLLWTFANESTKGKSVNCLHWNPLNKDILAVGYGKFYFADNIPGLVLIWNIKNPVQPERSYSFYDSVTSLKFSTEHPMLLAVGFYLGSVVVLNIVSREELIVAQNVPTFEAAWDICWLQNRKKDEEVVIAAFDNGSIISYSIKKKMESSQLMMVAKAEGKLKGIDVMKKCPSVNISVTRYTTAGFVRLRPRDESNYYVGTLEGVIHRCSFNYLNRHQALFAAHDGPVWDMKFSPFSKKIFATCGDDWHTRIWAEGISSPLFELYVTQQSIQGCDWSPTHSTILVDIRGHHIQMWDMQRKMYRPQSITVNPTGYRNTTVQFTESGKSLIVGDIDGNVHVFALEDMPFPAFFQENSLFESLFTGLKTEPALLEKLRKVKQQPNTDRYDYD